MLQPLNNRQYRHWIQAIKNGEGEAILLSPHAILRDGVATRRIYECRTRNRTQPVYIVEVYETRNLVYGDCSCQFGRFEFQRPTEKRICKHLAAAIDMRGLLANTPSAA